MKTMNSRRIKEIFSKIEKIIGIAKNEIVQGDYQAAIDSLILLKEIFNYILDKRTQLQYADKFKQLIEFKRIPEPDIPFPRSRKQKRIQSFDTIINIYTLGAYEIWETAWKDGNREICQHVTEDLKELLEESSIDVSLAGIVDAVSSTFSYMTRIGLTTVDERVIPTIHGAGYQWFEAWCYKVKELEPVNGLNVIKTYERNLRITLWFNLCSYIDKKHSKAIDTFLSSIFDGFYLRPMFISILDKYSDQFLLNNNYRELNRTYNQLNTEIYNLYNLNDLEKWWKHFNEFLNCLKNKQEDNSGHVTTDEVAEAWGNAVGSYLFNRLREFINYLAAYSLFINDIEFIKKLWNYAQPGNAQAMHASNQVLPQTILDILNSFRRLQIVESIFDYPLPGHNEIGHYYRRYHGLLFLRQYTLQKMYIYQDFLSVDDIPLSLDESDLESFKSSVEELKIYVDLALSNLGIIKHLGLDKYLNDPKKPSPDKIFKDLLIKLDNRLSQRDELTKISNEKVQIFKDKILDRIKKRSVFRNIITHFGNPINKTTKYSQEAEIIGVNEATIKRYFAATDKGNYIGMVDRYSDQMVYQENWFLRQKLIDKCLAQGNHKKVDEKQLLAELVNLASDEKIVIGSNIAFHLDLFENTEEFIPNFEEQRIDQEWVQRTGYQGRFKDMEIFGNFDGIGWKSMLILNKNELGSIIQYKPLNEDVDHLMQDYLLFRIEAYSDKQDLLKAMLEKPPDWLQDIGDRKQQESHLKKQVRIQIIEKIDLKFGDNFIGHSFYVSK